MSRPYELLIFDWDGTLADSAGAIVGGMQLAIAELGLPPRSDRQIREMIGLGFEDAVQRLYPELPFDELMQRFGRYARTAPPQRHDGGPAEAPLFEGALAALEALHREGYRIAIATGKSRRSLERSLRHHPGLAVLLSCSRCADETTSKPDPHMLRELLELEDLAPQRALMIGDTEYDIAMAAALRMPALGVACGVHDRERLRSAGAVDLLDHVGELPAWLAQREA
ncbi:MAG TPA: HAD-IA family hydrolase [Candidatus Binatia bacterium]|nr:HAD-IA family hydrolase [Candidatus Binatia bacterium]